MTLSREQSRAARLVALHTELSALGGDAIALPDVHAGQLAEAIAVLVHAASLRLRRVGSADQPAADRLCDRIVELQQLALDLYIEAVRARTERMAQCGVGLRRLRSMSSSRALLEQVCREVVERCGLERVVLSRVEQTTWTPWLGHATDGADLDSWFPSWVERGIELDDRMPEARLLTDRHAAIVYDTSSASVHRPIIVDAGRSISYVVAPVLEGSKVVGFLHGDHQPARRRVDEIDREVLWAFAAGFGYIFERTVLLERLRAQRDDARDILAGAVARIEELCELGDVVRESTATSAPDGGPVLGPFGELTARETDVFRLMVSGATNAAIADTLVITEDTVKSHVKRILGKLGATNRSQAVAWSHRGRTSD